MAGVDLANQALGMPRILPLLLRVGGGGGNERGERGGKSDEVEHVVSGEPITR